MSSPQYSVEGMVGPGANTLSWPYVFNRTYGLYGKNFFNISGLAWFPRSLLIFADIFSAS